MFPEVSDVRTVKLQIQPTLTSSHQNYFYKSNVVCTKVLHQAYNTLGHILKQIKIWKKYEKAKNAIIIWELAKSNTTKQSEMVFKFSKFLRVGKLRPFKFRLLYGTDRRVHRTSEYSSFPYMWSRVWVLSFTGLDSSSGGLKFWDWKLNSLSSFGRLVLLSVWLQLTT